MKIETTPIDGLLVIRPDVFADSRGYFFESFNKKKFSDAGIACEFVQDNQSLS
ncbi:MAG TPA: dTDP-4-dehydrorhamnose 3,5-epimerase family protein, partial [Bacteroidia bacterium]|nr:dTDP-4-dehydrorhamnose 3,5-epimerase family protein [Bacteroidia bacterium]